MSGLRVQSHLIFPLERVIVSPSLPFAHRGGSIYALISFALLPLPLPRPLMPH